MRPLPVAPLTKEDGEIWARIVNRSGRCFSSWDAGRYHRVTLGADRRDGDLMWKLSTYMMPGHSPIAHRMLRVDPDFRWLDLLPLGLMYEEERTE
jgi:hypothetical protein